METIGVQIAQVLAVVLSVGTLLVLFAVAVLRWMSAAKRPQIPVYVPVELRQRRAERVCTDLDQPGRVPDSRAPSTMQSRTVAHTRQYPRV